MNYKKSYIDKISTFSFKNNNKNYSIKFRGKGRRVRSFEFLLKKYPEFMSVHDEDFSSTIKDPNKAMNEFINDEGFKNFVVSRRLNSIGTVSTVDHFKLDLNSICKHLDDNGLFGKIKRRQPTKDLEKILLKMYDSKCSITGFKLFKKTYLKEKKINFFITLLKLEFDHRIPLFKGGSDDNHNPDNWQLMSEYANKEKNKICKTCDGNIQTCKKCALAFPDKYSKIYPSGQDLKQLGIFEV
tara:strand:- start:1502 stop:2224 length:723 start_codon:yes stop_codon:yes gene_type:complete